MNSFRKLPENLDSFHRTRFRIKLNFAKVGGAGIRLAICMISGLHMYMCALVHSR